MRLNLTIGSMRTLQIVKVDNKRENLGMIKNFTLIILLPLIFTLIGCQTNPAARLQSGPYNYTPGFIWGETSATAIAIPGNPAQKGYAITCREAQHCLNRANDLCSPNPISIISSQAAGERATAAVSAYGGGGSRTTSTLMQVACLGN